MKLIGVLKNLIIEQLLSNGNNMFDGISDGIVISTLGRIADFKRINIVDDNGDPKKAENGEELYNAIKNNKITVQEMGKVINSLLRNENIDERIINAAADQYVKSSSFKRSFRDLSTLKEGLLLFGLSKKAITAIYKILDMDEPGVTLPPSGTLLEKITSSIRLKKIAVLSYNGDEPGGKGNREIEPVALGYSKAGNDVVRAWDFWGASHTATIGTQPLPGWRLFRLDKIINFTPTNETFNVERKDYNKDGDKSMTTVLVNAKF